MKKVNIIILSVLILLYGSSLAFSQCETPPFVTEAVPPNVLIVLDTSESMTTEVEPGVTRWDVAKQVVTQLIQDNPDMLFGLMRMDGSNYDGQDPPRGRNEAVVRQGGKLLRPCGTDSAELIQFINAMPNNDPQTYTVLAETLLSAGLYFGGTYDRDYYYIHDGTQYDAAITDDEGNIIDTSSPIEYWCQKNYVIFITDGDGSYDDGTYDDDWNLVTTIGDYDGDGEEPGKIIVDNRLATYEGSWPSHTGSTQKYGTDIQYKAEGDGSGKAIFTPNIPVAAADDYRVYAWWVDEGATRSTNAPYTIYYNGGSESETIRVNQKEAGTGGKWNLLGTYSFTGGTSSERVVVSDGPDAMGTVVADAIMWERVGVSYMDDVAKFLYDNDWHDLAGTQNIVTYTVGFTVDSPLLQDAADNGGGLYCTCADAAQLTESLQAVVGDITEQLSSGTAVAVLSASQLEGDRLFRAKFQSDGWKGYLEAFSIPYTEGDTPVWEAGALLENRSHASRTIYTTVDDSQLPFTDSNWSTLQTPLGAADESEARNIINYIRGDNSNEQSQGGTYRNRGDWKLGDIVYSNPVVVGTPSYYYQEESYWTFVENNRDREKVLYVGANDGMLHAFTVNGGNGYSAGDELWAFIPENLLGKLKDLTNPNYNDCHEYFVDLSPKAADVYIGGAWKTVLLGGERAGGNYYFALDVTDPRNPQYLWDFTHDKLGESWAVPAVGKVDWSGVDKYVMFVGSGFENGDTKGYFFAVDIADGTSVWERVSNDTINAITSCTAVDEDRDSYIDSVYAGDLMGNIWKFDTSSGNPANWNADLLFHATDDALNDQPITVRPSISFDKKGNTLIYFGTGKFYDLSDRITTQQQAFYCLVDDGTSPTVEIVKAELVDQTTDTAITELPAGKKGWYINLWANGTDPSERVVAEAVVVADAVFFTTFIPNSDTCGYGGNARLWAVYYLTGGATSALEDLAEGERYMELGVGLPSAPVVSIKHNQVIVQTSDTTIHSEGASFNVDTGARIRAWREVFL